MQFIISTSFDNIQQEGSFFWGEKYFPDIRTHLPLNTTEVISITEGLIYFNRTASKEKYALKLKITQTHLTRAYLKIHYKVTGESEFKSYQIRNALKQYFNKKSVIELPFCCAVDMEKLMKILGDEKIFYDINNLELTNNWLGIYKMLEQHFPLEQSVLWNNADLLNKFAFATAKLSECSENLNKKYPDKEERKKILTSKKHFRELTIKIRKRCIELEPDNASYYSNLAYSYYQSVNELNMPKGRRDGNLIKDAENAIEYFDKALVKDNTRITDMYRKGILLSEILPQYNLYKSKENENDNDRIKISEKYNTAIEMINLGIEELIKLVKTYEKNFSINSEFQNTYDKNNHYKKYYVKALYHIAQKKIKITKIDFNLINLLYGYKPLQTDTNNFSGIIMNLNIANSYIDKCIKEDYSKKKEEKFLIDLVECDNYISGIYKAYLKALIETYLYATTEKTKHLITAKDFYYKALEMNFPKEQLRQNKIFINEKLSVLNLIEGKYDAAIKTLEPVYKWHSNHYGKNSEKITKTFPEYAAFTLSVSFLLIGDISRASDIIEEYINCGNKIFEYKFNKLKEFISLKKQIISKKINRSN